VQRADLNALEISDAIAKAIKSGVDADRLAAQLGWTNRNMQRYRQLAISCPSWLREFVREVKVKRRTVDANGNDVVVVETHPGLPFTHVVELITLYNKLHEKDRAEHRARNGEGFKPQAERIVRKLAARAAADGWSTTRMRVEIQRHKDPAKSVKRETASPVLINDKRAIVDIARTAALTRDERAGLVARIIDALNACGFKNVAISV